MDTNIEKSLRIAQELQRARVNEVKKITEILNTESDLDDSLVIALIQISKAVINQIEFLQGINKTLKEQKEIFGKIGLPKELPNITKKPREEW